MRVRNIFVITSIVLSILVLILNYLWPASVWIWIVLAPLIALGTYDFCQKKHTIKRNFPVVGNFRYLLERFRPEIMQYFVETDSEGRPINRLFRTLIYERSKKVNDTTPFGTQVDVYNEGYEWMEHSVYARNSSDLNKEPRVLIGGTTCKQPYSANLLNISAMSFGALSKNAVLAMNTGAKMGGFAQNTGEGGLSHYHLQPGGDVIWQIGTGYFGCRTLDGVFCPDKFKENSIKDSVKMIEIKISQGAKPGHGGILPAVKNTEEIAKIRGVKPATDVFSPPGHTAFTNATELMQFVDQLRQLSGGKPIGFKVCVGKKSEFVDFCEAMVKTKILPDFITVDGGEGGTGAAPVEFSNSLGMPLRDALAFVVDTLKHYNLRKDIKVIASGKVFSAFHIARLIALGADLVNSARAMMLAAGCIQALECNSNNCPTGVATQDPTLMKGLNVADKAQRVANFHGETIHAFNELLAASGLDDHTQLSRDHICRRVSMQKTMRYSEIYPEAVMS